MRKNRSQRKFGSILSETFSSDDIHSILSNPTDTLQALNESNIGAKIQNITQSAKNKLKKFYNGDFLIRYKGTFAQIRQDLRKLLSLNLEGRSDYAVYDTPNGKLAFRLTDHNANGNNFEQDGADNNISVYVAFEEFDHIDCTVHYKEFKISPEVFNSKRVECVNSIINGVYNALNGGEFDIDNSIAEMKEYNKPIKIEDKSNNNINCSKIMKKKIIRLTESQLHKLIKEAINQLDWKNKHMTSLKQFMKLWYDNDDSYLDALEKLQDESWLHSMGWFQVFHEGYGNGVCSPYEGCVAVFDEDDLPEYHSYSLYKYNPKAWVSVENGGWDDVYNGDNGEDFDVEPY